MHEPAASQSALGLELRLDEFRNAARVAAEHALPTISKLCNLCKVGCAVKGVKTLTEGVPAYPYSLPPQSRPKSCKT